MPLALPTLPFTVVALTLLGGAILGAALIARAMSRRERRARRRAAADLARDFRAFRRGVLHAHDLVDAASACAAETFWSAIEAGARRGRSHPELARALARCEHVADEARALRDDSPWRRELAARRLGLVRSRAIGAALRRAMARGPEMVTHAAARALAHQRDLGALRWLLGHPAAITHRTPRARAALLLAFGPGASATLIQALASWELDPAIECAAIDALAESKCGVAAAPIAMRLSSADPELRTSAARALGRIGASEASAVLRSALEDREWPVRAQAARALGRIGDETAATALSRCLCDPAWWVRRHAAYALAALGGTGRDELARAAASSDRYAREMAEEALHSAQRRVAGD
ncbi:MAG: HEAT repeat domain-containing protein [Candidatus Eisenbacteria bacterium]|nr:HEAT repeat domain-containing protein [Candidatus Eisenbacteria bacterium]